MTPLPDSSNGPEPSLERTATGGPAPAAREPREVPPHPDSREITILSGSTWYRGFGEKYDPAALIAMPAGSYYTEPANIPHFMEMREPVVIQVSGTGPSGRKFFNPEDNQK